MSGWGERIISAFVSAYPAHLRRAYGSELRCLIGDLARQARYRGVPGRLRLWWFLLRDVGVTIARERVSALPSRPVPRFERRANRASQPYGDAFLAALAVLALYIATLAPTVAFWDSGEYLTAAHTLGIPHQPGNPLIVMLAHVWEWLLWPTGLSPAIRLNLFSAVMSAAAHFSGFWSYIVRLQRFHRAHWRSACVRELPSC